MVKLSKRSKIAMSFLIVFCGIFFVAQKRFGSSDQSFTVRPDADFYIVGYHNIEGYQLTNEQPQKISDAKLEVVKGQINQVVKRAELSNRYLVFSEEGPPLGAIGRLIALDFQKGKVTYHPTADYAFTSSGVSPDYYFTSTANTDDSFIAVFDPKLKEIDKHIFEDSIIASDFSVDGDDIYLLGTDVKTKDNYPTYLYTLSIKNGKLALKNKELLYEQPESTYFFHDSIVKEKQLYTVSSGYRNNATKERTVLGQVFHYDMQSGQKHFFDLTEIAPVNIFDLGHDTLAIEHEKNETGKIGFSLFYLNDKTSTFIDLSQFGLSIESDYLKDIKQIDENTLLILAGHKLIGYHISDHQVIFDKQVSDDAFHIWVK
ncbi:TPA: hypothetical protein TVS26_000185 [Streptococcus equi subsp. zooepidemicus]|nr:hypothetical protein LJFMMFNO_01642 [Streptococcus equi subsp. zooepidemicus]HEL1067708.1 hypothetical protein [Streptococcus equi subsp. zooepidemicus]HEL1068777.1 hypothetical protein [Streptococcus equi subsp. zooepidemicus]HEL1135869.1 hypothetical protein [Streptococcus equi subsp. zooepidemicus]HEL1254022.1 hypothetical protein [Streptococcus equi subsp. zooepidemicus]